MDFHEGCKGSHLYSWDDVTFYDFDAAPEELGILNLALLKRPIREMKTICHSSDEKPNAIMLETGTVQLKCLVFRKH